MRASGSAGSTRRIWLQWRRACCLAPTSPAPFSNISCGALRTPLDSRHARFFNTEIGYCLSELTSLLKALVCHRARKTEHSNVIAVPVDCCCCACACCDSFFHLSSSTGSISHCAIDLLAPLPAFVRDSSHDGPCRAHMLTCSRCSACLRLHTRTP